MPANAYASMDDAALNSAHPAYERVFPSQAENEITIVFSIAEDSWW